MLLFYDFEVFKYDWLVVFIDRISGKVYKFHNDVEALREFLHLGNILIGFNNYNYDDIILTALIHDRYSNIDLYNLSQAIVTKNTKVLYKLKARAKNIVSFDCMQELQMGVSLKSIECNLGVSIKESNVPWDLDRPLNEQELEDVFNYCEYDVRNTEKVYELRKDYFQAKVDIVKEFKINPYNIKKTRSHLASQVLKASQKNLPRGAALDRLNLSYVNKINWNNIPAALKLFYDSIIKDFKNGMSYLTLEKLKLSLDIAGVTHTFGFGGVHGALVAFKTKQKILYLDVSSYYPSLMIVYHFLSRACESPELYKNLYDTRFTLKKAKELKEYIYKILLNASYGATKDKYSEMFDPLQANNICVNGQIILVDLIQRVKDYTTLVQSNTDGIMLTYNDSDYNKIMEIIKVWEDNYNLKLGQKILTELYQRDVNNYIYKTADGKISGKGIFKNWDIGTINFESNSLSVVAIALKRYYLDNISIKDTINYLLDNNILTPFQLVAKKSNKYDGLAVFNSDSREYITLNHKVNRVFASVLTTWGKLYKITNVGGAFKYDKYTNTPNNIYIHNDDLKSMNKSVIDKNWYISLCESYLIENQKIKKDKVIIDNSQLELFDLFDVLEA